VLSEHGSHGFELLQKALFRRAALARACTGSAGGKVKTSASILTWGNWRALLASSASTPGRNCRKRSSRKHLMSCGSGRKAAPLPSWHWHALKAMGLRGGEPRCRMPCCGEQRLDRQESAENRRGLAVEVRSKQTYRTSFTTVGMVPPSMTYSVPVIDAARGRSEERDEVSDPPWALRGGQGECRQSEVHQAPCARALVVGATFLRQFG